MVNNHQKTTNSFAVIEWVGVQSSGGAETTLAHPPPPPPSLPPPPPLADMRHPAQNPQRWPRLLYN